MDLTRQIIQLLSEPPGSFIYHLVTLFALQVVFAISYSRWRRQPEDDYARNMSWAAGAIVLGRLILLFAGLFFARDAAAAASILPPLEQAINTASVLLLVWALVPSLDRYPRTLDILLISSLVVTGVMYLFFAQEWQASERVAYYGTSQATIWTLVQIAILTMGLGYLLFHGRSLGAFPPIIIGTLLAANVIHLWNYPEFIPTGTNVAYWVRIGNLIALPLWAVYAYLYAMTPLLESESRLQDSAEKFGGSIENAAQVIATKQSQRRIVYSLQMMNQLFDTSFAAIGLIDDQNEMIINFYGAHLDQSPGDIKQWSIDLSEHVTLNTAMRHDGSTLLLRDGLGSRQLYGFFEAADLLATDSLLIHPLARNGTRVGMLAVPTPGNGNQWREEAQTLIPGLADFIAQALVNSRIPPAPQEPVLEPEPDIAVAASTVPAAIVMDKVRVQDLEYQADQLRQDLQVAENGRRQAETNAAAAQKQARYLAAALRTVQPASNNSSEGLRDVEVSEPGDQDILETDVEQTT